jgi:hypothetical protein
MPDAAETTRQALINDHSARMQRGMKVTTPNGGRISAAPYLGKKYPGEDGTLLLAQPEKILKKPNPRSKYVWRVRTQPKTGSMVAAGHIRPVEMEEIDRTNALASIIELVTPSGSYVVWEDQALFEMPQQYVSRYYTDYEDYALSRLANQAIEFSDQIEGESGGAYQGTMQVKAK